MANFEVLHPYYQSPPMTFEKFQPFMSFEGINPEWTNQLEELLHHTFQQTRQWWKPGFCIKAPIVARVMQQLAPSMLSFEAAILPMFLPGRHGWTEIKLPDLKSFIVDPVGILEEDLNRTWPYFGLLENAKTIYANGEVWLFS